MLTFYFLITITLTLMGMILTHPNVSVSGAADGLRLWFNSAVPSLFPFMVLTGILTKTGILRRPLFTAITGLLCGYPMGISTVCQLREEKQLSEIQAMHLSTFVNQPGPMFILGYALPLCNLNTEHKHCFLGAFYGGICLTALFSRVAISARKKSTIHCQVNQTFTPVPLSFPLFEEVLVTSLTSTAKIGGYMVLFSVISALLGELIPGFPVVRLVINGLLEMTSGAALAAENTYHVSYFVLGFISFGGLCVTAQSFTLGNLSVREQYRYLFWKVVQTIFTLVLYMLLSQLIAI